MARSLKPKKQVLLICLLGLVLFFGMVFPAQASAPVDEEQFRQIESNLMCTDGCGMWLPSCDNATAQQMRTEIRNKLAEGASAKQIYAYMISVYGEEVMAAPPPQSRFNLAAWALPFLLILGGALVIYLAMDKWVFNRAAAAVDELQEIDEQEIAVYEDLLETETRKFL